MRSPAVIDLVERFTATAKARPCLAGIVIVLRLGGGSPPPTLLGKAAESVLAALTQTLCGLSALEEVTLVGPMVGTFLGKPKSSIPPRLRSVVLAGPPSDLYISLRNLAQITSLRLNHPALATATFLDRVHEQLGRLTALNVQQIALPLDHPAITLLLSGDFGRRLKHLGLLLSPGGPTQCYSRQLLALAPNLRSLTLSTRAADISELPSLAHLGTLSLCDVDPSDLPQRLTTVLRQLVECLAHTPCRLPSLRHLELGQRPAELSSDEPSAGQAREWLDRLARSGIAVHFASEAIIDAPDEVPASTWTRYRNRQLTLQAKEAEEAELMATIAAEQEVWVERDRRWAEKEERRRARRARVKANPFQAEAAGQGAVE